MKFTLDDDVQFILKKLNEYGSGYIVGGAIRDKIMGIDPDDYDFATDIDYEELKEIFKENAPNEIGANFGILSITLNGKHYEIAKFRKEKGVFNNRYPKKIKFVNNIKEDLKRRDFTINSLGYNEEEGLINVYDGVKHIENKIIKFVGVPKIRIEEDALRILRAFRFMAKFGFELDKKTADGIREKRKLLGKISRERIFDEFVKILTAPHVKKALKEMKKLGVLEKIIPEYSYLKEVSKIEGKNIFNEIVNMIDKSENDLVTRLSILFYQLGKVNSQTIDSKGNISFDGYERESSYLAENRLRSLKVSNKIINSVRKIVLYHLLAEKNYPNKVLKKIMLNLGREDFERLVKLMKNNYSLRNNRDKKEDFEKFTKRVQEILANGKIPMMKNVAITGVDLINLRVNVKDINKIKEEIYELILDDMLENEKMAIVQYLAKKYNLNCDFKMEKSCGAIVYSPKIGKYLLVKTQNGNWGFAKGHTEEGETELQTAMREVKEETNIDIKIVDEIRETIKYIPKENVFKEVVLFLGLCEKPDNIIIQADEIEEAKWCSYEEAIKLITYKVQRDVLDKVNNQLEKREQE